MKYFYFTFSDDTLDLNHTLAFIVFLTCILYPAFDRIPMSQFVSLSVSKFMAIFE